MTAHNANSNPHWLAFTGLPSDGDRLKFLDEVFTRFGAPLGKIATDYFGYSSGACLSVYFSKHGLRVSADRKRFNTPGVQRDWQEFCAISVKPITVQPTGYAPILPTKQQRELDHQRLMESTVPDAAPEEPIEMHDDEIIDAADLVMASATHKLPSMQAAPMQANALSCTITGKFILAGNLQNIIADLNLLSTVMSDRKFMATIVTTEGDNDETTLSD